MFDSILSAIIVSLLIMSCSSPSKERAVASNDTSKVAAPVDQKSRVSNDSIATGPQIFKLHPHLIQLQNGDSFYLEIPGGYRITVAAETGTRLRFLRTSPDGRLFATDMHDRTDNKKGRVLLFENWSDRVEIDRNTDKRSEQDKD